MKRKIKVLGIYNYTVWLTYLGLFLSVGGMMAAINKQPTAAVVCLALSGLCDAFDGKVAARKKDRTKEEKAFGVQIDSLCDIVCFGVFPAVLCFTLGVDGAAGRAVILLYCVCGVIRLAQFNVNAGGPGENRAPDGTFRGVPITFMSVVLPLVYAMKNWLPAYVFSGALHLLLAGMGISFIVDFPVPKLKGKRLALAAALVAAALAVSIAGACRG